MTDLPRCQECGCKHSHSTQVRVIENPGCILCRWCGGPYPTRDCWLVCRDCDGDEVMLWTPIPFESYERRGKWAAAHTAGTGHDRWFCGDTRTGDGDQVAAG